MNTQIQGNRISIGYKLPLQTGICCAGESPCKLFLKYEGQLIAPYDARYRENRMPQLLRRRKNSNRNQPQGTFSINSNYVVSRGETVRLGFEPDSASLLLAEQVDSGEYKRKQSHKSGSAFFGTRNRNQPQETFSLNSNYVVSRGETVRLGFEPDSASLLLAEQVDSGEYKRKQSHKSGSAFFGTRNRNRTCN